LTLAPWPRQSQVFHCVKPDADGGGKTVLVDGFKVADVLKRRHRETFDFFCKTPLPFHHIDSTTDHRTRRTVRCAVARAHFW
jgi:hypothetical protein